MKKIPLNSANSSFDKLLNFLQYNGKGTSSLELINSSVNHLEKQIQQSEKIKIIEI